MFAKNLCEEMNPAPKSKLLQLDRCTVAMADLVVRSNGFYCNKIHTVKDIAAEIEVIGRDDVIINCLIPAVYCESCNTYFVLESTYAELKKQGIIKAKIISYKRYKNGDRGSAMTGAWKEIGILKEYGYNVSEEDGYTSEQRHSILINIIERGIQTRENVLSYLEFFIKMHESGTSAVDKWKEIEIYV